MSYRAVAGALALVDVSAGERLVALSLASYANAEHRAYPGTRLVAVRAGMSRTQFLAGQGELEVRGLVVVENEGGGRGKSQTVALLFAETGPWFEHGVNAPLLERVLSYSRQRGSTRLLLAVLAAVADDDGVVARLSTEELCAAAGLEDRTYRRARTALLESGEVSLIGAGGGRARMNEWLVRDPRAIGDAPLRSRRDRPVPPPGARPLMATAKPASTATDAGDEAIPGCDAARGAGTEKGPILSGVSNDQTPVSQGMRPEKGPDLTGVSDDRIDSHDQTPISRGLSEGKGPILSGVSDDQSPDPRGIRPEKSPDLTGVSEIGAGGPKTPAETPAQTPAPNARTGREPLNPLTSPPNPPGGGNGQIQIVEEFINDKGRRRKRTVSYRLDEIPLALPSERAQAAWRAAKAECERITGTTTFEIWLAQLELAGTGEHGELLLLAPPATTAWIRKRFGRLFDRAGDSVGCRIRITTDRERQLLAALSTATSPNVYPHQHKEAI